MAPLPGGHLPTPPRPQPRPLQACPGLGLLVTSLLSGSKFPEPRHTQLKNYK